ncbi:MAG: F0F1 ATP synthase subunit delta [Gammaproteobacteria bacterium]
MLIDWFTVIAQVINFLVLAWLLKRFLYRPILNAIDAREERIAAELADADAKKAEADKQCEEFRKKNAEFDKQQATRMNQVAERAKAERVRLLEALIVESGELRSKMQSGLKKEQLGLKEALSQRAREEVFAIARKTLADLAGTTLEARMVEIFIDRLGELNDEKMAGLKSAFKDSTQPLQVRTAIALEEGQCALIEAAVKDVLGEQKKIQFTTNAELVSGIEISTNGQVIGWSIADYLSSLSESVDQLLQEPVDKHVDPGAIDTKENGAIDTEEKEPDGHESKV